MKEVAIGIGIMWVLSVVTKQAIKVQGLPSILFMGFIAWGLGSLVLAIL